jgi:hypothetical protein
MNGLEHIPAGHNAFTACVPRGDITKQPKAKKRYTAPSKTQQAANSFDTVAERKARKSVDAKGRAVVDLAPRSKGAITIHNTTDADKTQRIKFGAMR